MDRWTARNKHVFKKQFIWAECLYPFISICSSPNPSMQLHFEILLLWKQLKLKEVTRLEPWFQKISVLIRDRELICPPRVQKDEVTQETVAASKPREASTEYLPWWSWISQPPQVWEINFCLLSHPVYNTFLWQSEQNKTELHIKNMGFQH